MPFLSPSSIVYIHLLLVLLLSTERPEWITVFWAALRDILFLLQQVHCRHYRRWLLKNTKASRKTTTFPSSCVTLARALQEPDNLTLSSTQSSQCGRVMSSVARSKAPRDSSHLYPHSAQGPPLAGSLPCPLLDGQSILFSGAWSHCSTCHGNWSSRLTCVSPTRL